MTTTTAKSIEIIKDRGGFGQAYKAYSLRPYAVKIDGKFLLNASGNVRTFETREGAEKAGEKAAKEVNQ